MSESFSQLIAIIILPILLAIFTTISFVAIVRIIKKSLRIPVLVLISISAIVILGFSPLMDVVSGIWKVQLPIILICLFLLPLSFIIPFLLIGEYIPLLRAQSSVFLVSLSSSFLLLFMGLACAFGGDYFSVYEVIIIPGLVRFAPKLIGFFLEGCIFACGGYGILLFFSTLWEIYRNRASDSTARGYLVMGGGSLALTGIAGCLISPPNQAPPAVILIFLGLIAGTGIAFFFALQRVANKYLRIGIPAILGLLFLGTIVIAPLIPCLFFFGEGTMIIIMAGLGAVTLLPLIQEKIHKLSVMSALIIASPAIVLGFLPYGILNFLTHCASMEDRISSEPGLFLAVYLTSMVVSVSVCWILLTTMNGLTKNG